MSKGQLPPKKREKEGFKKTSALSGLVGGGVQSSERKRKKKR